MITGNLEAYKSIASQCIRGIPDSFISWMRSNTILMNPFIEYIRAALEMVTKGFSYESVFRYLRCDMSGLEGTRWICWRIMCLPLEPRLQKSGPRSG